MAKKSKWPTAIFISTKFRRIAEFIINMKTIVLNIGNASGIFVTPNPPLATVTLDIKALELAETTAKTRVVGSAAARDLKYDVCYKNLQVITNYVQDTANAAPDAAAAISIIEASGLSVKVNGVKVKAPISAKNTVTGVVELNAKSGGRDTIYMWQSSPDGAVWSDLPMTQLAKTTIDSLVPATKVFFRVRTMNKKNGTSDWSAAIVIIVV